MRTHHLAPFLVLTLAGAACGSGDGPAQPSWFVDGTQSLLGSLTVNDVPFTTRGATVRFLDDDRTVTVGEAPTGLFFYPGMNVAIRGTVAGDLSGGGAEEVVVRSVLRGPLQGRGESSIAVAGADVLLDARTAVYDAAGAPTTIAAIPAGQRVEVHGWPIGGTRVRATLVRALDGSPALSLRGWSRAAAVGNTFELSLVPGGDAVIRVEASGLPLAGVPANALVFVAGDALAAGGPPTLSATTVRLQSQILPQPGDRVRVEGIVSSGSPQEFSLGDHLVRTTSVTSYEGLPAGGTVETSVAPGTRVIVEGPFLDGAVTAQRLQVIGLTRLAGATQPGSFHVGQPATSAVFVLGGKSVLLDATTRITGPNGASLTIVQLADLHGASLTGLPVVVHGYERTDGNVQATRVDVVAG